MNLIIYVNSHFEEERALVDISKGKVLVKGDYYHDKIDESIAGYLKALKDFNLYKEEVESEWIENTHPHYEMIGFYEE